MASSSSSFPVQYFSLKKCLLFLVVVCVYASLFACREAEAQLERRDSLGGRRALLVLDDEFEEIQPKKKKPTVAKETEETQLKKKVVSTGELDEKKPKKKNSVVDEEAEQLPRKKKYFLDEMEEKPKKKKTPAEKSEDLKFEKKKTTTEELVEQKRKKKQVNSDELEVELPTKKKSTILEEDEDKVPKKKKAKISEEEDRVPKKKKTTLEEEDELPKKKKGNIVAEEDKTQKKKKTSTEVDVHDVPKKKKKAPIEEVEEQPKKKKASTEEVEEQGKKKKITTGGTAQTKFIKPIKDSKNQTKFPLAASKKNPKSLNSTSNPSKSSLSLSKKSAELPKTQSKTTQEKKSTNVNQLPKSKSKPQSLHSDDNEDLITEFRDLPSKFQSDIKRFSTTSKVYLSNANREISQSFRPLIGSKYASIIASVSPYIFLLVPLIILPLIYGRIRNFFLPLQTILIFAQIYLSIYFSILCLSYLVTGMEPLKVYYATSKASYVYTQMLQTLAYVLFLLVQVMCLVVVFATKERGTGARLVSLAQMVVGLAIGIHYYVSVAHRAVLREPPRTNWKVHAIYAACFTGVCLLARAERRKKAYLQEGGEEGKQN
ncbi:uncharacterized protein [Aristolochia californica]|uniref:uncharacterized protein n=1 Tax=Aristolochia californica TaxID=171875 RepID=UPI0035D84157